LSRHKGGIAERQAIAFLLENGFEVVETNFYAKKLGEIDIIAKKQNILHFCEVKSATIYEEAIKNFTQTKLFKIKKSVEYYLQTKKQDYAFCIDAIIVCNNDISYIENITM